MDNIATALKTLGHPERLRILALLSRGELTVSELVQIMGLSQPRITQYIKSLEDAGIIERLKEGSWVFSRISRGNEAIFALVATTLNSLPSDDRQLLADQAKLENVRAARAKSVDEFFADVANDRGQLGDEYLPRDAIDAAMRKLVGDDTFEYMVDLGTGTGRVLKLFADQVKRGSGIDNNADMLKVARHNLSGPELSHLSVRQGDLSLTPIDAGSADLVTLHQVLHYLIDPEDALQEAARLLVPGGRLLIVDYVAHNQEEFREKYAHRRLGFTDSDINEWLSSAGFAAADAIKIENGADYPDVKIWSAIRRDDSIQNMSGRHTWLTH